MRLVRRPLRSPATPGQALLLLDERARHYGLPAPAALTGDWFESRAVLVPSVRVQPVGGIPEAFAVPARLPRIEGAAPGAGDGAVGGGWIGYLGYGLTDPFARPSPLPNAAWGWADHVLRLDAGGQWWFEAIVPPGCPDPDDLADDLAAVLDKVPDVGAAGWTPGRLWRSNASTHTASVRRCIKAIEAGELFQANICTRFHGTFDGAPAELFAEGTRTLRPRRAAYLAGKWGAIASLSPELFLARKQDRVWSTPIKGTLPRRGPADDRNAERLRRSEKDVAENVMITDLVRNDLGRVSEVGSVTVPELLAVTEAPGVWHLQSTVESRLAAGIDDSGLLHATFPPGSVTGAPKLRALELIAELEMEARGVYCGAIGLASPIAGLELKVAIRTFELHEAADGGYAIALGVGGGITGSSDPELEWQECLHKAAPLEALLARAGASVEQRYVQKGAYSAADG